jgi:peptide/nickel transport system substrate-binding protein
MSRLKFLTMALVCLMVLSACGGGAAKGDGASSNAEVKQELVIAQQAQILTLDPAKQAAIIDSMAIANLFEGLVAFDENLQLIGVLAETWDVNPDATEFTFHLRQNVKFHDGTPFNAEAVKFSMERILDPKVKSGRTWIVGDVKEWQVVDEHTIKAIMKRPTEPFLHQIANFSAGRIVSPTAVKQHDEEFFKNPIGTGPFKFVSWRPDEALVLEANNDYWKGKPKLQKVTFRPIVEPSTRMVELEKGTVQLTWDVPSTEFARLQTTTGMQTALRPPLNVRYMGLNTLKAPFDNVKVRQAVNYAVDKQVIADRLMAKQGVVTNVPLPPVLPDLDKSITGYPYDVAKAKQLLTEAGFPNGLELTAWTWEDDRYKPLTEAVANQLLQVGIKVNITVFEWGTFLSKLSEYATPAKAQEAEAYDMFILGWAGVVHPYNYLQPLFQSTSPSNRTLYSSLDDKLTAALSITDAAARTAAYSEMQQQLVTDAPWIFLPSANEPVAWRSNVKGYAVHPIDLDLFPVYIEGK